MLRFAAKEFVMYSVYRRAGVIPSPPRFGDFNVAQQASPGFMHHYGPTTWANCAAEMRRLRAPGWGG